jgi:hypothetical protein
MKTNVKALASIAFAVALAAVGESAVAQNASPNISSSGGGHTTVDRSIEYHNGPVMVGTSNVYLIWYGCWGQPGCNLGANNDATVQGILPEFLWNLGVSPYFQINSGYPNFSGTISNGFVYGGQTADPYSHGPGLTQADLQDIVVNSFSTLGLPVDSSGIYVVLTSADVTVDDPNTHFCLTCCQLHGHFPHLGVDFKYAFVGNPARCPGSCASGAPTPNGNMQADWMALWMTHALNGTVTNPYGTGWYDRYALENSDKCEGSFGTTYSVTNPNGQTAQANIHLGVRDYLIEQNWVNGKKGHCAMSPTQ